MRHQFQWPALSAVVTAGGLAALGVPVWAAGLCFGLCAFVSVTMLQEFVRGARVRQKATETDLFTAFVGLFARSKRRYGGYVVHLGIVLIFLGFAGGEFEREEQVLLAQRQNVTVAPYTVTFHALHVTQDSQKQMITAEVSVERDGDALGRMYPARWFYAGREDEPTTEVALRRAAGGDLYLVLAAFDVEAQTATLLVKVNPLINWIWMGVGIMMLGTGIALLPERVFAFAAGRVPEGAVTASLILLMIFGAGVARVRAQHVDQPGVTAPVPASQLERDLTAHIVCMCGTCGRKRVGECTCSVAAGQREEIARLVAEGKTFDEVVTYFVAKYGSQEVLAAPIDEGFNRLAWALPYLAGLAGIVIVGGVAVRWTRRSAGADAPESLPRADAALESKLDDALRDLD
jgi:cytochrome c-type biogenesis protein CcmF